MQDFFEDREGTSGWRPSMVSTAFVDMSFPPFRRSQGFRMALWSRCLRANDGSVWIGSSAGLDIWQMTDKSRLRRTRRSTSKSKLTNASKSDSLGGDSSRFRTASGTDMDRDPQGLRISRTAASFAPLAIVPRRCVHSMAEDRSGQLWIATQFRRPVSFIRPEECVATDSLGRTSGIRITPRNGG